MAEQRAELEMSEFESGAQTLNEYFSGHSGRQEDVQAILDKFLSGPPTEQSASQILEALSIYAGDEVAQLLAGYLAYADQYPQLLDDYEMVFDEDIARVLRRWLSIYGNAMTEAANLRDNPEAWKRLNREVYFEQITQTWHVNLQIIKFNGETFDLRETPNSVVILAQGVLDTLLLAGEYIGNEAFDQQSVDDLVQAMSRFITEYTEDAAFPNLAIESEFTPDGAN